MSNLAALGGLFSAAFIAATFFPAQSEAVLIMLILKDNIPVWILIAAASAGNVLGACVNWVLGRCIETFKHKKWFPIKEASLEKAQAQYKKYGRWSLLLSWVPIIGDPITIISGVMRERFLVFLAFVSVAKAGRYIVLAMLTLKWLHDTP